MRSTVVQTVISVVFLLLFAWILNSFGQVRILNQVGYVEQGSEASGIVEPRRLSTDQYAQANEIPTYLEAMSQISVYDYQAKELNIYKSISEINFDRLAGLDFVVARERIRGDVSGFTIYANPLSLKTTEQGSQLQLELWIGLNETELTKFLKAFDFVKMRKRVLNDLVFLKALA